MKNKYTEGSIWRKWDLHFHTQSSYDYEKKSITDEEIINTLSDNNISVVAITDHHIIDVDRIQNLQKLGKKKNITVFPGIEFRSELGGSEIIHFIGIFPENSDVSSIWIDIQSNCNLKPSQIEKIGKERIYVDFKETADLIHKLGGLVTVHAGKKTNTIENIRNNHDYKLQIKTDLLKDYIDILEIGKPEVDILGYNNIVFPNIGFKLPLIICSDNHNVNNYTLKQNCWIKADPTFEGLKQIIYEPNERVRIQETNPFLDFEKPYFSEINFKDNEIIFDDDDELLFKKSENKLSLNQNLVAIIGGRGEGKSMLTDYIASSFKGYHSSKEGNYKKDGFIEIKYQKTNHNKEEAINLPLTNEQHAIDFIYINQGKLKSIAEKREEQESISKSIQKLAKLAVPESDKELSNKLYQSVKNIHSLDYYFSEVDNTEEKNKINSLEYLENEEKAIKSFIENITTSKNRERLENYTKNIKEVNILNDKKQTLKEFNLELINTIEDINKKIELINGDSEKITPLDENVFKVQQNEIDKWIKGIELELEKYNKEISNVKLEFKDYKGDLTTLLNDIDKFQNQLFEIQKKIIEVKKNKELYKTLIDNVFGNKQRNYKTLLDKLQNDYEKQRKKLISDWESFSKIEERTDLISAQKDIMKNLLSDLSIDVDIKFDVNRFYDQIWECIDGSKYRIKNNRAAQIRHFGVNDIVSYFDYLKDKYIDDYNSGNFHKDVLFDIFFNDERRKKYISIVPILKYKGKDLNKISTGQKGTVYLKMKLATEAFSKPIIFDQPEDDLDNEFIMNNLIGLFKELKKYRQLIIVTHNANLVVNADAEQIIIANNIDGELSYISGSLENKLINKKICDILEGGETAFTKRKEKYVFNN